MAGNGSGWSKGKVLAVVIPLCLLLAGGAVAAILIIGKDSGDGGASAEIISTYEEISKQAEAAMEEMDDLGEAALVEDYEQQLAEAEAALNAMVADVDAAAAAVEEAASSVEETSEEYEALYMQIEAYYAYLESLYAQAIEEVAYLQSIVPALEELQDVEDSLNAIQRNPGGTRSDQTTQLLAEMQAYAKALADMTTEDPYGNIDDVLESASNDFNGSFTSLVASIASGDAARAAQQAGSISTTIDATISSITSEVASVVGSYASMLDSLASGVTAAIP